ncbi:MAG: methyltransferase domain-containing protein [Candidatus Omnitrophica bacterium]|nr:methyltransferase domain-containing protein [Candidatus Omnitrophota bacterium]
MKKLRSLISLALALQLALPNPAGVYPELSRRALRVNQLREDPAGKTLAGLEEALQGKMFSTPVPGTKMAEGARRQMSQFFLALGTFLLLCAGGRGEEAVSPPLISSAGPVSPPSDSSQRARGLLSIGRGTYEGVLKSPARSWAVGEFAESYEEYERMLAKFPDLPPMVEEALDYLKENHPGIYERYVLPGISRIILVEGDILTAQALGEGNVLLADATVRHLHAMPRQDRPRVLAGILAHEAVHNTHRQRGRFPSTKDEEPADSALAMEELTAYLIQAAIPFAETQRPGAIQPMGYLIFQEDLFGLRHVSDGHWLGLFSGLVIGQGGLFFPDELGRPPKVLWPLASRRIQALAKIERMERQRFGEETAVEFLIFHKGEEDPRAVYVEYRIREVIYRRKVDVRRGGRTSVGKPAVVSRDASVFHREVQEPYETKGGPAADPKVLRDLKAFLLEVAQQLSNEPRTPADQRLLEVIREIQKRLEPPPAPPKPTVPGRKGLETPTGLGRAETQPPNQPRTFWAARGNGKVPFTPTALTRKSTPPVSGPTAGLEEGTSLKRRMEIAKGHGALYISLIDIFLRPGDLEEKNQRVEQQIRDLPPGFPKSMKEGYLEGYRRFLGGLAANHALLEDFRQEGVRGLLSRLALSLEEDPARPSMRIKAVRGVLERSLSREMNDADYLLTTFIVSSGLEKKKDMNEIELDLQKVLAHPVRQGSTRLLEPTRGVLIVEVQEELIRLMQNRGLLLWAGAAFYVPSESNHLPNFIIVPDNSQLWKKALANERYLTDDPDVRHEFHHLVWDLLMRSGFLRETKESSVGRSKAFDGFRDEVSAYIVAANKHFAGVEPKLLNYLEGTGDLSADARKATRDARDFSAAAMEIAEQLGIPRSAFLYASMTARNFSELKRLFAELTPLRKLEDLEACGLLYAAWEKLRYEADVSKSIGDLLREKGLRVDPALAQAFAIHHLRSDEKSFQRLGELDEELGRIEKVFAAFGSRLPSREGVLEAVFETRLPLPLETRQTIRTFSLGERTGIPLGLKPEDFLTSLVSFLLIDDPATGNRFRIYQAIVRSSPVMLAAFRKVQDEIIRKGSQAYRIEMKGRGALEAEIKTISDWIKRLGEPPPALDTPAPATPAGLEKVVRGNLAMLRQAYPLMESAVVPEPFVRGEKNRPHLYFALNGAGKILEIRQDWVSTEDRAAKWVLGLALRWPAKGPFQLSTAKRDVEIITGPSGAGYSKLPKLFLDSIKLFNRVPYPFAALTRFSPDEAQKELGQFKGLGKLQAAETWVGHGGTNRREKISLVDPPGNLWFIHLKDVMVEKTTREERFLEGSLFVRQRQISLGELQKLIASSSLIQRFPRSPAGLEEGWLKRALKRFGFVSGKPVLEDKKAQEGPRAVAARDLIARGEKPEGITEVVGYLESVLEEERRNAQMALTQIADDKQNSDPAKVNFLRAMNNAQVVQKSVPNLFRPGVYRAAYDTLRELVSYGEFNEAFISVIPILAEKLSSSDGDVRLPSLAVLNYLAGFEKFAEAIKKARVLEKCLANPNLLRDTANLYRRHDVEPSIYLLFLNVPAYLGTFNSRVIPLLAAGYSDSDPLIRNEASRVLLRLAHYLELWTAYVTRVIPAILGNLMNPDESIRDSARSDLLALDSTRPYYPFPEDADLDGLHQAIVSRIPPPVLTAYRQAWFDGKTLKALDNPFRSDAVNALSQDIFKRDAGSKEERLLLQLLGEFSPEKAAEIKSVLEKRSRAPGTGLPGAAGLEEVAEELKGQTLKLLNDVFGGSEIKQVTREALGRLQERFDRAPSEEKRGILGRFWEIYLPSLRKLARQRIQETAATARPLPPGHVEPSVVIVGPAVNLNLNIGWMPDPEDSQRLVVDPGATSLKANGSPTNVMETLLFLGTPFRSIGMRGADGAPVHQIFFELLGAVGIDPQEWPRVSGDVDFVPTMSAGTLGLDYRFIPPLPPWKNAELSNYTGAVSRVTEELATGGRPHGALAVTSRVPANAPSDFLSQLFRIGKKGGLFVVYDPKTNTLENPEIRSAIVAEGPHLITPNLEEFSVLVGLPLEELQTPEQIIVAAHRLIGRPKTDIPMILISLGDRGALLIDKERAAYANVPPVSVVGPGGAGDAGLAGLLRQYAQTEASQRPFSTLRDSEFLSLLRAYVAAGAAAVLMPGDESPFLEGVVQMEQQVRTTFFRGELPSEHLAGLFTPVERPTAQSPYQNRVWVPRLGRFFFADEEVISPDNAGSDLYLNFILSNPSLFRDKTVLEPFTGSGVLAYALASVGATVVATDVSESAIRLAERNRQDWPPEIRGRVTFGISDVYGNLWRITALREFDVMIGNNPTQRQDPLPGDGASYMTSAGEHFEVIREAITGLAVLLKPGGSAYLQTRVVQEQEEPLRRLTAEHLKEKLLPEGWDLEPTSYEGMGRTELIPLVINRIFRTPAGLEEEEAGGRVRGWALSLIGRLFQFPSRLVTERKLMKILKNPNDNPYERRLDALEVVSITGDKRLRAKWDSSPGWDLSYREAVIKHLARMGSKKLVPLLREILQDPKTETAAGVVAAREMIDLGATDVAVAYLGQAVGKEEIPPQSHEDVIKALWKEEISPLDYENVIRALGKAGGTAAVGYLGKVAEKLWLGDGSPSYWALEALGRIGSQEALDRLRGFASHHKVQLLRFMAQTVLTEIENPKRAIPSLKQLMLDSRVPNEFKATVLERIAEGGSPDGIAFVGEMARDLKITSLRDKAVEGLVKNGSPQAVGELAEVLRVEDGISSFWASTLEGLATIKTPEAVALLGRLATDKGMLVLSRSKVIDLLLKVESRHAIPHLAKLAQEEGENVLLHGDKQAAALRLIEIGGDEALPYLKQIARNGWSWTLAIQGLGEMGGVEGLDFLARLAVDKEVDPKRKERALFQLADVSSPEALDWLRRVAMDPDQDPTLQAAAMSALMRVIPRSLPYLLGGLLVADDEGIPLAMLRRFSKKDILAAVSRGSPGPEKLLWLPPVGSKVPVALRKEAGGMKSDNLGVFGTHLTAEGQLRRMKDIVNVLGAQNIHQMTVQGRLTDPFKYVAALLILATPTQFMNLEAIGTGTDSWKTWLQIGPLVHDGLQANKPINPLWGNEGRTDFLLLMTPEEVQLAEGYPIKLKAYQRLALALHAAQGTVPSQMPKQLRERLADVWREFVQEADKLLVESYAKPAVELPWFSEGADSKGHPLSAYGKRQEADWGPIQQAFLRAREKILDGAQTDEEKMAVLYGVVGPSLGLLARFSKRVDQVLGVSMPQPAVPPSPAGLEEAREAAARERLDGMRSAALTLDWVVIGKRVAGQFPGLEQLAGLEERILIDGDDPAETAFKLIQRGAAWGDRVTFFGGLEEGEKLTFVARDAGLTFQIVGLKEQGFSIQLRQILAGLGIPDAAIAAGLEEMAADLTFLGQAA